MRSRHIARIVAGAALVVAAAIAAVVLLGGDDDRGHVLHATLPEAANVIEGQEVRAGGKVIGTVDGMEAVQRGRAARVTLRITDEDVWPLPRGTTFTVRWGGTATFYNRHVLVKPGPRNAASLPDGGTIPARDFRVPVEFDQLLSNFDSGVRRDLKGMVDRSGPALQASRRGLAGTLDRAPGALDQGQALLRELTAERGSLDATIRSTDRVIGAVKRANPGISPLIESAASTFSAIADRSGELERTVAGLPPALRQVRDTLPRADRTLNAVRDLAADIRPGVRELRAVATPIDATLASLQRVTPDARRTLRTVRTRGDGITAFASRLTTLAPQLSRTADEAITAVKCVRPWTPEIVALALNWGDFMSWSDGKDKILRAQIQNFLPAPSNSMTYTPAEAKKVFPQMRYGFPRPPGYNAGQPWFIDECGAGKDAIDPSKDQEAKVASSAFGGKEAKR